MSTKTSTNTQNQYNPAGMGTYNAFQPVLQRQLLQMAQNPLSSSYFQNALAQMRGSANALGARNMKNTLQNARTGGGLLSNSGAFSQALTNQTMLNNSQLQSNAFNSALSNALQNRNWALSSMESYQPLQTGQNSTQTTGGLGTWLPQLAGAAIGGLSGMGGFGALGSMFKGASPLGSTSGGYLNNLNSFYQGAPPPNMNMNMNALQPNPMSIFGT